MSTNQSDLARVWRVSGLTRDGTAKPVSQDQILRRERGHGNMHFPSLANHEQDWQPYPVDPYSFYMCDVMAIQYFIHYTREVGKRGKESNMVTGQTHAQYYQ